MFIYIYIYVYVFIFLEVCMSDVHRCSAPSPEKMLRSASALLCPILRDVRNAVCGFLQHGRGCIWRCILVMLMHLPAVRWEGLLYQEFSRGAKLSPLM